MQITFDPDNRVEADRVWNMLQCLYPDMHTHPIPQVDALVRKVMNPKPKAEPCTEAAGLPSKPTLPQKPAKKPAKRTQHPKMRNCYYCDEPFMCDHALGIAVCPRCKADRASSKHKDIPSKPEPEPAPEPVKGPLPAKELDVTGIKAKIDAGELGKVIPTDQVTSQANTEKARKFRLESHHNDRGDKWV